jgi:hypothetical protein
MAVTNHDMVTAIVSCPHNREKRSVTEVHVTLSELGWHHVCACCENWFVDRSSKHMDLCRRCCGPQVHGWFRR